MTRYLVVTLLLLCAMALTITVTLAQQSGGDELASCLGSDSTWSDRFEPCLEAADRGHAEAQEILGRMYRYGMGIPRDDAEALRWFGMAAKQGDAWAQFRLGQMYATGTGVPEDDGKAVGWFQKAGDQGDVEILLSLARGYGTRNNSLGVPADPIYALKWYRKAADSGDDIAQSFFDQLLQNIEEANRYRKAAVQGNANAQAKLGEMYFHGRGVAENATEAARWLRMAAEQGNVDAQFLLGRVHDWYSDLSDEEGAKWYLVAAVQGSARAQHHLGKMYKLGKGVPQNLAEAVRWYRKAAEQGELDALHDLGLMYKTGEGVSQDYIQAYAWLDLSNAISNLRRFREYEPGIIERDKLKELMTRDQILKAKELSATWLRRIEESRLR